MLLIKFVSYLKMTDIIIVMNLLNLFKKMNLCTHLKQLLWNFSIKRLVTKPSVFVENCIEGKLNLVSKSYLLATTLHEFPFNFQTQDVGVN